MKYRINVVFHGTKFFETEIDNISDALEVVNVLKRKFPETFGWTINYSVWSTNGYKTDSNFNRITKS